MAREDYESEEEIEEIRQENPAVRAKVYFVFALLYAGLILSYTFNPLPVRQEAWPWFFAFIAWPGVVLWYLTKFLVVNGSARVLLGDTEFTTIHDTKKVSAIREMYNRRGEFVHGRYRVWRVSGYSNVPWKGRNFAIFPDDDTVVEDRILLFIIHADFDRYMWWELPPWMRTKFVIHGKAVLPGFHRRKSKIYLAWEKMDPRVISKNPHANMDRIYKMLDAMLYQDERAFYRGGVMRGQRLPTRPPGIGTTADEGELPLTE